MTKSYKLNFISWLGRVHILVPVSIHDLHKKLTSPTNEGCVKQRWWRWWCNQSEADSALNLPMSDQESVDLEFSDFDDDHPSIFIWLQMSIISNQNVVSSHAVPGQYSDYHYHPPRLLSPAPPHQNVPRHSNNLVTHFDLCFSEIHSIHPALVMFS